ncbi:hypothetical protein ACHZ98_26400 [Streptomyces sp. MAR4 CNY-716]
MKSLPSWQDKKFGSKVRAALWLESEVGETNTFTKARLREAFPDVSQIDRRIRDLRDHGWRIDTRREDPSLKLDEQRYVKKGAEIWIPGQAKAKKENSSLTATQRNTILQGDNFLCRTCGIGAGEVYEETRLAQLDIARRKVRLPDGTVQTQLVTECNRCRTAGSREVDLAEVMRDLQSLSVVEQGVFARWVSDDHREVTLLEKLWGVYRTLPDESRQAIKKSLENRE